MDEQLKGLTEGLAVKILIFGQLIDRGIITKVDTYGEKALPRICIKSTANQPDELMEFVSTIKENSEHFWAWLFPDPIKKGAKEFSEKIFNYKIIPAE